MGLYEDAMKLVDDGRIIAVREERFLFPGNKRMAVDFSFYEAFGIPVFDVRMLGFDNSVLSSNCYRCPIKDYPCVHVVAVGIWWARNNESDGSMAAQHEEEDTKERKKRNLRRTEWPEAV